MSVSDAKNEQVHYNNENAKFLLPTSMVLSTAELMDDLQVVLSDVLALWCLLIMHQPMRVKARGQDYVDVPTHLSCSFSLLQE